MGKKKERERQAQAQQAALAGQQQAAAAAAAQQASYQAQLAAQNQQYSSLLTQTQGQIAEASKPNIEAPAAQLVGVGIDEAEQAARKKSANRFGLSSTIFAGKSNKLPAKSLLA